MSLSDPAGAHVSSALTDLRGRFLFTGIHPGRYTVRAQLIGFSTEAQTVSVGVREATEVELRLEIRAIELEGLSVEGEGRCSLRPEAGLRVVEVWEEARKALEAARWTEEHGVYEYRTRRYSHDVEEQTGLVAHQESRRRRVYLQVPYESRPAQDLIENGFIQSPTDGSEGDLYFAPDAAVLLSDIFLDGHCMRVRAGDGDEDGLVGLDFEPMQRRRIPDISGTLWIDPGSWQLSHLEYTYEDVRPDVHTRGTGGEVAFRSLSNGTWIVPEWRIRVPLLAKGRGLGRETVYQYGYREEGGAVVSIREPGGDVIFSASTAALEGVVLEELSSEPVAGAMVWLAGTEERVTSDEEGRFRFTAVVPGRYEVRFESDEVQAQARAPEPVGVELVKGDMASVVLTLPSPFARDARACLEEMSSRPDGSAIVVGRVTERELDVGLEGAHVTIEWDDPSLGLSGQRVVSTTGPTGRYRACVVPDDTLLRVSAEWGPFTSIVDTIRVPEGARGMGHDIVLGVATRTALAGTVLGWSRGEAVSSAEVRLVPLGGGTDARPTLLATDAEGRFTLPEIEVGLHVLKVTALGYAAVSDTVEARAGRVNHVSVRLPEEALEIEGITVEVEARLRRLDMSGFYDRRREGLGVFLDADTIQARSATSVAELLDRTMGVYIGSTAGQLGVHEAVVIRGCLPAVYIDGTLARRAGPFDRNPNPQRTGRPMPEYLDDLVNPSDIAGMEVYRSPAELPVQYAGTGTDCGVILIWTH